MHTLDHTQIWSESILQLSWEKTMDQGRGMCICEEGTCYLVWRLKSDEGETVGLVCKEAPSQRSDQVKSPDIRTRCFTRTFLPLVLQSFWTTYIKIKYDPLGIIDLILTLSFIFPRRQAPPSWSLCYRNGSRPVGIRLRPTSTDSISICCLWTNVVLDTDSHWFLVMKNLLDRPTPSWLWFPFNSICLDRADSYIFRVYSRRDLFCGNSKMLGVACLHSGQWAQGLWRASVASFDKC